MTLEYRIFIFGGIIKGLFYKAETKRFVNVFYVLKQPNSSKYLCFLLLHLSLPTEGRIFVQRGIIVVNYEMNTIHIEQTGAAVN